VLLLFGLTGLLGYLLLPDASTAANRQLPALAKRPPGSQAILLVVYRPAATPSEGLLTRWWQGTTDGATYLPVYTPTVRHQQGQLHYTGLEGQPEQRPLAPGEAYRIERVRFWLGTDAFGRDVLSRILLGTRVSLGIGLLAVAASLALGVGLGSLAGYLGGWADRGIQFGMTVIWSLPSLLLAISLAYVLGKGVQQLVWAIALSIWIDLARVVRGQVLGLRQQAWVQAARVLGYSHLRVLRHHILPNMTGPIIILACSSFATAILLEAGLSFLGLGIAPPTPSWGGMIQEGYAFILFDHGWWLAVFPGICIAMLILSLNLVALGLRDALDPRAH
jgi:peptide/nickel transport system permease protein